MQPDAERIAVAWAKSRAPITALVGAGDDARVATRLPGQKRNTDGRLIDGWAPNFLRVFLVDGSTIVIEDGDIVSAVMQFDAYAKQGTAKPSPNYADASLLARTVAAECHATADVAVAGEGSAVAFGSVTVPRRVEEAEAGWARFMFTAELVVRPIPAIP